MISYVSSSFLKLLFMQGNGSPVSFAKNADNPQAPETMPPLLAQGATEDRECSLPLNQIQGIANKGNPKSQKAEVTDLDKAARPKGNKANGNNKELLTCVPDSSDLELDLSEADKLASDSEKKAPRTVENVDPHIHKPDAPRKGGNTPAVPHVKSTAENAAVIALSEDDEGAGISLSLREGQQGQSQSDSEVQIVEPPLQEATTKVTAAQQTEQHEQAPVIRKKPAVGQADANAKHHKKPAKQRKKSDAAQGEKAAAKKKGKKVTGGKKARAKAAAPIKAPATRRAVKGGRLTKHAPVNASKAAKEDAPDWLNDNAAASVSLLLSASKFWQRQAKLTSSRHQ